MGTVTTPRPATRASASAGDLPGLYDRHAAEMFAYARLLTRSQTEAEDAVQEAFLRVARQAEQLATVRNLRSYLFRVLRNEALRQRSRWLRWRARDLAGGVLCLEEAAEPERRERAREVEAAMQRLPAAQREVVFLKVWQELTFAEIGKVFGVSNNTVASRYRYGIEKLRELLSDAR